MLNNKQFIFGGVVAVLVSVVTLTIVFLPNSFEPDIVYQKSELATVLPIIPSVAPALVVPEIEVAAKTTEIEESTEEPDFDREEKKAKLAEIKKSKKKDQLLVPVVPFYSQFSDITSATWQKVGCGIASLAMLIEYYNPGVVTVDTHLEEGIAADAYLDSAGWTYSGLIGISKKYGMGGQTHDFGHLSMEKAYKELITELEEGPVMASVHYTFQKSNPIPHLVIINGVDDGEVYYNDPAEKKGGGSISVAQFQSAWKKRYIEFRLL